MGFFSGKMRNWEGWFLFLKGKMKNKWNNPNELEYKVEDITEFDKKIAIRSEY